LQADPVIAVLPNTITVKSTPPIPSAGNGDTFGQILQCTQDAAVPVTKPTPNNDAGSPQAPAASVGVPAALQATAADPLFATAATPKAATAPGVSAKACTGSAAAKPARTVRNDCQAGTWQSMDQTAAMPPPTVDPATAILAVSTALPAPDAIAPGVSHSAASMLIAGTPGEPAAAPQAAPSVEVGDQAALSQGRVLAPPASNPAVSANAPVVPTSEHAPIKSVPVAMPDVSALRGLNDLAAGEAAANPGRDLQRFRPVTNPGQSRQRMPMAARPGGISQSAPEAIDSIGRQQKIPLASSWRSLSQVAGAESITPRGPGSDNSITLRPTEVTADPVPLAALSGPPLEQSVPIGILPAMPSTASASALPQVHAGDPTPPAVQVRPALMILAKSTDGSQETTIRLQPAELGSVQIRIARAASGATHIEILAERSTTLLTLQRDQPQLHRTLDEAGIPAAGRTVTFHPVPPAEAYDRGGSTPSSDSGDQRGQPAQATGNTGADASVGGGRGNNAARKPNKYSNRSQVTGLDSSTAANAATIAQTYHIGIDITA
jgi:flagellar hook-length control protein FliK